MSETNEKRIQLGMKAKDVITGFAGVVTAHLEYLTGCDQYCLTPPIDKDGKLVDTKWFDESRLLVTDTNIVELIQQATHTPAPVVPAEPEQRRGGEYRDTLPERAQ